MHITKKPKALLAIAAFDFETTRSYTKVWINHDEDYCKQLITDALKFFESEVFPKLMTKFKESVSDIEVKTEEQVEVIPKLMTDLNESVPDIEVKAEEQFEVIPK